MKELAGAIKDDVLDKENWNFPSATTDHKNL